MWYTFAYFYLDSAPFGYSFARKALFCLPDERVLFLSYVCLSAHEKMLRIVKLLRSEVSAEVGRTLYLTLRRAKYFTSSLGA